MDMQVRLSFRASYLALSLIIVTGLLFCCTSKPVKYQTKSDVFDKSERITVNATGRNAGNLAATLALEQIGVPYRYGGVSPSGFDCSGLAKYVYDKLGIALPRRTRDMARIGRQVPVDSLLPGDLLFFRIEGHRISHVGIHVNAGEFVHATKSGQPVRTDSLFDPWWRKRFVVAKRLY